MATMMLHTNNYPNTETSVKAVIFRCLPGTVHHVLHTESAPFSLLQLNFSSHNMAAECMYTSSYHRDKTEKVQELSFSMNEVIFIVVQSFDLNCFKPTTIDTPGCLRMK